MIWVIVWVYQIKKRPSTLALAYEQRVQKAYEQSHPLARITAVLT